MKRSEKEATAEFDKFLENIPLKPQEAHKSNFKKFVDLFLSFAKKVITFFSKKNPENQSSVDLTSLSNITQHQGNTPQKNKIQENSLLETNLSTVKTAAFKIQERIAVFLPKSKKETEKKIIANRAKVAEKRHDDLYGGL